MLTALREDFLCRSTHSIVIELPQSIQEYHIDQVPRAILRTISYDSRICCGMNLLRYLSRDGDTQYRFYDRDRKCIKHFHCRRDLFNWCVGRTEINFDRL